ncbi:hypothetical protein HKBW3S25_01903, partial [Candidatus Hakubella thermalkaliphila]
MFLDGIVLKIKTGFGSKKETVLVAYGVTVQGKRELIDFMVVSHEGANVSNYLRRKDQDKCIKEARAIYNARNRQEAGGAFQQMGQGLNERP